MTEQVKILLVDEEPDILEMIQGMTRDTADKIFDPFFATKFIGRGLGLSAAYGIVVNHGGWMEVDTRENQGTQIRILLPLVKDQTRPSEASLPGQIAKGDATILLIEDEEMVMKAVHQLLDRMEYQVLEAGTGQMALEVLTTFTGKVDIALLDVHLPDLEAVDLYEKMRHIRPDLKVIVCSGYNKEGPVDKLLSSGATAFLQKPFSVQQLSAELKSALEADSSEASMGKAVSI